MRAVPLFLALLAPTAAAGAPFVAELTDARGDVLGIDGAPVDAPSADVLSLRSEVVNGTIVQRVELAARPIAPDDSILLRNWYADSENGSWHVIDLEVDGAAPEPSQRFKPFRREGAFENVTVIDARYGLENATWVFAFDASLVADATCFDPGAFVEHTPPARTRQPQGFDDVYDKTRACVTTVEPGGEIRPPPPLVVGVPTPSPRPDPPGSGAPTPALPVWAVAGALALTALRARRTP